MHIRTCVVQPLEDGGTQIHEVKTSIPPDMAYTDATVKALADLHAARVELAKSPYSVRRRAEIIAAFNGGLDPTNITAAMIRDAIAQAKKAPR